MRNSILAILLLFCSLSAYAQADRSDVRAGNRKFRRGEYKEAEIDYRKAVLKDSTSVTAQYDLASSLYRQEDYAGALKALSSIQHPFVPAQFCYNGGNAAAQQKDWQAAVNLYKQALLRDPSDLEAKENYIYAKKMLENQQGGGGDGQQDQNQDQQDQQNQQNQQNQDQNRNQNQDQDRNDNQNNDRDNQDKNQDGNQDKQSEISPQEAQRMLRAIQAKEKETQDKVNKEKAALLKSRQKEKNW